MKKEKSEGVRERILGCGIRLFAERGYHGVSVDEIVGEAGVSKRMVYHYFGSKERLYQEVLVEVYGWVENLEEEVMEGASGPEEAIRGILEAYFNFHWEHPEFARLILWENLNGGMGLKGGGVRVTKNPVILSLRKMIDRGVAEGAFRADLDPVHLLIHMVGLCSVYHSNRYTMTHSLGMDLGQQEVREEGLRRILSLVFEGIRNSAIS